MINKGFGGLLIFQKYGLGTGFFPGVLLFVVFWNNIGFKI